jgi:hypothetical protein
VRLVQQDQRQHLADAGDAAQAVEGLDVIDLGGADQVQLQVADQLAEAVDQGQVDGGALVHAGVGEALGDVLLGAVGGVAEFLGEGRQVVLGVEDLQVGHQRGALADEGRLANVAAASSPRQGAARIRSTEGQQNRLCRRRRVFGFAWTADSGRPYLQKPGATVSPF